MNMQLHFKLLDAIRESKCNQNSESDWVDLNLIGSYFE